MRKLTLFFLLLSFNLSSQEVVSELISNTQILKINKKYNSFKSAINIPFIDDFSNNSYYPDSNLWEDQNVYVNRNYAVDPITIGVATFDGLDKNGRAYDMTFLSTDSENADTLTSHKIDLSVTDTAYFMFYFQPQGNGNDPQPSDSLILEFLDVNGVWNNIWKKEGSLSYDFRKFVFVFTDATYLYSDFQFRFRNLASISGNFDHWNIDYVKLDAYHSSSDTSELNDVSFIRRTPNILKRYKEMPWIHFVNDVVLEMNDTLDIQLKNNTNTIQSIDYRYDVYNKNGALVFHYPTIGGNSSTRNVDVPPFPSSGNYSINSPPVILYNQMFPVSSSDSAEFTFRNNIHSPPNDYKMNDTVSHLQKFYSHFSYDDESAESAYGINVQGAKLAYKFKLNRPDTLRVIQMKFVEMHEDLLNNKFALTVWSNNNGLPDQELYKDTVEIDYKDRGKFTNYFLKNGVGLIGTFFVGWEQITDDILNLGLDKNSIANDYMFYNIGGGWVNSQFPGAWMIRPVVNYDEPLINSVFTQQEIKCEIFPNPFSEITSVYFSDSKLRIISVYDMMGRNVKTIISKEMKVDINKENLKNGMYFIQISDEKRKITKKLILN